MGGCLKKQWVAWKACLVDSEYEYVLVFSNFKSHGIFCPVQAIPVERSEVRCPGTSLHSHLIFVA